MKQIIIKQLLPDNYDSSIITRVNSLYHDNYISRAFGIKIEDTNVNEMNGKIKVFYSVPEFYENGWFDCNENKEQILKKLVQKAIAETYKIAIIIEDLESELNDLEQEMIDNTKFYVKTRKDEMWTDELSNITISEYNKKIIDAINQANKYPEYKEI